MTPDDNGPSAAELFSGRQIDPRRPDAATAKPIVAWTSQALTQAPA